MARAGFLIATLLVASVAFASANELSPEEASLAAKIDRLIADKAHAKSVPLAAISSDAEFLRRAYLDLVGTIPTAGEARAFLADDRPDRRHRLINTLLARPDHATHLATLWRDDLLASVENREIIPDDSIRLLDHWLRTRFLENDGYDTLAAGLITATGSIPDDRGAAIYIAAHQTAPERLATGTSRMFLGVQIDCAQCHDHFFADWTQEDFWSFAAVFAEVRNVNNANFGMLPKLTDDRTPRPVTIPETTQVMVPRFPGENEPLTAETTRREAFARWLTGPDNPYFATAAVNRLWAVLFGYGLVHPIDNMGPLNPPSHPKLLELLADDFTAHDFNIRRTLRILANTKAYGRSSRGGGDPRLFARKLVRPLTPRQLHASLRTASGELPALQSDPQARQFVENFSSANSRVEYQSGIPQALLLLNGETVAGLTNPEQSRLVIGIADSPFFNDKERVETLFLAALSRDPRSDELDRCLTYLTEAKTTREGLSDILWALLNSSEFALNH